MEPRTILQSDPLDILFENRNKAYGAYTLRKYYNQRLLKSIGVTMSFVTVLVFLYLHFRTMPMLTRTIQINDLIPEAYTETLKPKVKPLEPPVRPSAPKAPATVQHTPPVIVPDRDVLKPVATIADLTKSAIGTTTIAGEPDNAVSRQTTAMGSGNGSAAADSTESKPRILTHAEFMPEFPGGIEALKRYLLKNLRMPDNANMESGEQIKVIARFVVGSDGKVSDIEITRPADLPYNTEVKRVISKMPDWKPGMQNNHAVAVYFSLPVNFVGGE